MFACPDERAASWTRGAAFPDTRSTPRDPQASFIDHRVARRDESDASPDEEDDFRDRDDDPRDRDDDCPHQEGESRDPQAAFLDSIDDFRAHEVSDRDPDVQVRSRFDCRADAADEGPGADDARSEESPACLRRGLLRPSAMRFEMATAAKASSKPSSFVVCVAVYDEGGGRHTCRPGRRQLRPRSYFRSPARGSAISTIDESSGANAGCKLYVMRNIERSS